MRKGWVDYGGEEGFAHPVNVASCCRRNDDGFVGIVAVAVVSGAVATVADVVAAALECHDNIIEALHYKVLVSSQCRLIIRNPHAESRSSIDSAGYEIDFPAFFVSGCDSSKHLCLPFMVDGQQVGYVSPAVAESLQQLQALLDETDYLDPFQFSFRPGYGNESALVALYDDLCREKDRGSASLLVLLDLSAAFDTIDHGILLDRLAGLGVGGTALQWFRSYLNGRFQKVVLGDYGSAPWQLCHGVPQGSILSPLLFNIYMKPLGKVIRRCGLRSHQYADDTQLYLSFSTNPGEAVAVLNRCLAEVMGWMRANKLKLNPDKTEVLLVGGSGFGEGGFNLVLNGVALPLRDKVRSLGVLLDPELSLEAQATVVARSAFLQLRLIHQLRPYLEYDCLATVTHALVTSRLDFCNALYLGLPLKMLYNAMPYFLIDLSSAWNVLQHKLFSYSLLNPALLGVKCYGTHLNGYTWKNGEMHMWLACRALNKPTYPGLLNNLSAGGIATGLGVREMLVKESQEACLPVSLTALAKAVGTISYTYEGTHGEIYSECLFIFDLELPQEFVPQVGDGEVKEFYLWPLNKAAYIAQNSNHLFDVKITIQQQVKEVIASSDFKPNSAMVALDFLIRHSYIQPDEEPYYVELVERLHRTL
ncbi:Nudix hydrolase 20, chloroplastic [Varanus komodoensis]|nr:Nudix hydrolase 20, chloroplastic [Varanus komodoensis]